MLGWSTVAFRLKPNVWTLPIATFIITIALCVALKNKYDFKNWTSRYTSLLKTSVSVWLHKIFYSFNMQKENTDLYADDSQEKYSPDDAFIELNWEFLNVFSTGKLFIN